YRCFKTGFLPAGIGDDSESGLMRGGLPLITDADPVDLACGGATRGQYRSSLGIVAPGVAAYYLQRISRGGFDAGERPGIAGLQCRLVQIAPLHAVGPG